MVGIYRVFCHGGVSEFWLKFQWCQVTRIFTLAYHFLPFAVTLLTRLIPVARFTFSSSFLYIALLIAIS
jgi:hypothetical protein